MTDYCSSSAQIKAEIASLLRGDVPCWSKEDYEYRQHRLGQLRYELRQRGDPEGKVKKTVDKYKQK